MTDWADDDALLAPPRASGGGVQEPLPPPPTDTPPAPIDPSAASRGAGAEAGEVGVVSGWRAGRGGGRGSGRGMGSVWGSGKGAGGGGGGEGEGRGDVAGVVEEWDATSGTGKIRVVAGGGVAEGEVGEVVHFRQNDLGRGHRTFGLFPGRCVTFELRAPRKGKEGGRKGVQNVRVMGEKSVDVASSLSAESFVVVVAQRGHAALPAPFGRALFADDLPTGEHAAPFASFDGFSVEGGGEAFVGDALRCNLAVLQPPGSKEKVVVARKGVVGWAVGEEVGEVGKTEGVETRRVVVVRVGAFGALVRDLGNAAEAVVGVEDTKRLGLGVGDVVKALLMYQPRIAQSGVAPQPPEDPHLLRHLLLEADEVDESVPASSAVWCGRDLNAPLRAISIQRDPTLRPITTFPTTASFPVHGGILCRVPGWALGVSDATVPVVAVAASRVLQAARDAGVEENTAISLCLAAARRLKAAGQNIAATSNILRPVLLTAATFAVQSLEKRKEGTGDDSSSSTSTGLALFPVLAESGSGTERMEVASLRTGDAVQLTVSVPSVNAALHSRAQWVTTGVVLVRPAQAGREAALVLREGYPTDLGDGGGEGESATRKKAITFRVKCLRPDRAGKVLTIDTRDLCPLPPGESKFTPSTPPSSSSRASLPEPDSIVFLDVELGSMAHAGRVQGVVGRRVVATGIRGGSGGGVGEKVAQGLEGTVVGKAPGGAGVVLVATKLSPAANVALAPFRSVANPSEAHCAALRKAAMDAGANSEDAERIAKAKNLFITRPPARPEISKGLRQVAAGIAPHLAIPEVSGSTASALFSGIASALHLHLTTLKPLSSSSSSKPSGPTGTILYRDALWGASASPDESVTDGDTRTKAASDAQLNMFASSIGYGPRLPQMSTVIVEAPASAFRDGIRFGQEVTLDLVRIVTSGKWRAENLIIPTTSTPALPTPPASTTPTPSASSSTSTASSVWASGRGKLIAAAETKPADSRKRKSDSGSSGGGGSGGSGEGETSEGASEKRAAKSGGSGSDVPRQFPVFGAVHGMVDPRGTFCFIECWDSSDREVYLHQSEYADGDEDAWQALRNGHVVQFFLAPPRVGTDAKVAIAARPAFGARQPFAVSHVEFEGWVIAEPSPGKTPPRASGSGKEPSSRYADGKRGQLRLIGTVRRSGESLGTGGWRDALSAGPMAETEFVAALRAGGARAREALDRAPSNVRVRFDVSGIDRVHPQPSLPTILFSPANAELAKSLRVVHLGPGAHGACAVSLPASHEADAARPGATPPVLVLGDRVRFRLALDTNPAVPDAKSPLNLLRAVHIQIERVSRARGHGVVVRRSKDFGFVRITHLSEALCAQEPELAAKFREHNAPELFFHVSEVLPTIHYSIHPKHRTHLRSSGIHLPHNAVAPEVLENDIIQFNVQSFKRASAVRVCVLDRKPATIEYAVQKLSSGGPKGSTAASAGGGGGAGGAKKDTRERRGRGGGRGRGRGGKWRGRGD